MILHATKINTFLCSTISYIVMSLIFEHIVSMDSFVSDVTDSFNTFLSTATPKNLSSLKASSLPSDLKQIVTLRTNDLISFRLNLLLLNFRL